jgi:hypothetical protein
MNWTITNKNLKTFALYVKQSIPDLRSQIRIWNDYFESGYWHKSSRSDQIRIHNTDGNSICKKVGVTSFQRQHLL